MHFKDKGIIIAVRKLGDDAVVTILTAGHGVISVYQKNKGGLRNKRFSLAEPLCYCEFLFFQHRDRVSVDEIEVQESFYGVRRSVSALSLGIYFGALCKELCSEGEGEAPLRLLRGALLHLAAGKHDERFLKAVFELRLLAIAGYAPSLAGCSRCGAGAGDMALSLAASSLVCASCSGGAQGPLLPLPPGVLAAVRYIIHCDIAKVFSFSLGEGSLAALADAAEQYALYTLEKSLPSLEYYKNIQL